MKYKLLYTVIIPILLLGCGDNEDSLSPSNIDRDWFIIEVYLCTMETYISN